MLPRSKSKRVIIDLSDDYEDQAASIRTTTYSYYEEAKKAVDKWQERAGQLTHIDKEVFAGKRPKRGSQPESVTVICKSAVECPFKCKIELQADKSYRVLFIDTAHTCRPGSASILPAQQASPSPEVKIPQALKRHLASNQSPTTTKRHQSIKVWRKNVASCSSPSDPDAVQPGWPEEPNVEQKADATGLAHEKSKSKGTQSIREAMQPRPNTREDKLRAEPKAVAVNELKNEPLKATNNATQKSTTPQKHPAAPPTPALVARPKPRFHRTIGTAANAAHLAGLDHLLANASGYDRFSKAKPAPGRQPHDSPSDSRKAIEQPTPRPTLHQPASSAINAPVPTAGLKECDAPSGLSAVKSRPAAASAKTVAQITVSTRAYASRPSEKRIADEIEKEVDKPIEAVKNDTPVAKRPRLATPAEILLADKRHGLDPHLVNFLATAGIHHLSDIVNLGMMESDMDAFLSGVYARMEEMARSSQNEAARIRAAVKNCAEVITIAKVKGLFRL